MYQKQKVLPAKKPRRGKSEIPQLHYVAVAALERLTGELAALPVKGREVSAGIDCIHEVLRLFGGRS